MVMSSSIITPTDKFNQLSLNPPMAPSAEEIRQRIVKVRDVMSHFDANILPSEYRDDICANLDSPLKSASDRREWTIPGDFMGTMLQWCAYHEDLWKIVVEFETPTGLARSFNEKLQRRLNQVFERYDSLDGQYSDVDLLTERVNDVAYRFSAIIYAIHLDSKDRELGQTATARQLLRALRAVCERRRDVALAATTSREGKRSVSAALASSTSINLYQQLIEETLQDLPGAFLTALDILDGYPPEVIQGVESEIEVLSSLLQKHRAPTSYIARFQRLVRLATDVQNREDVPDTADATRRIGETTSTTGQRSATSGVGPSATVGIGASETSRATTRSTLATTTLDPAATEPSQQAGSKRTRTQQGSSKKGSKKTTR